MPRPAFARSGFTLGELLAVCAILLALGALLVPGLLSSHRASNERGASATLKTVMSAEADFRSNDRDGNGVNDFWTADVKGLYTMTGAAVPGPGTAAKDPAVQLIDRSLALADADGTFHAAAGENMPIGKFGQPAAPIGYWYLALLADLSLKEKAERAYKVETGGMPRMGAVHHMSRVGFAAFPDRGSTGKVVFIVNENNTIFRLPTPTPARLGSAIPPGPGGLDPAYQNWPSDAELKSFSAGGQP